MNAALLLCLLWLSPLRCEATPPPEPPPSEAGDVLNGIDLSAWDSFFAQMEEGAPKERPSLLARRLAEGEADSMVDLPDRLLRQVRAEVKEAASLWLLALITGVLSCLCGVLTDRADHPARRVLSVGLCALLLSRMLPAVRRGIRCFQGIMALTDGSIPLMTTALLLLGSPRSAAAMGALGEVLLHTLLSHLREGLLPLVLSAGVLKAADLSGDGVLSALSRVLFSLSKWVLRLVSLGYMLFATLLGSSAAGSDALLLRTGRAAAGSMPLVGSILADSLEAAMTCLGVVKGAIGRTGVLLALLQVAGPSASLFLQGAGLRAMATVLEPLDQREMGAMLRSVGEALTLLGALVCAAGAMLAASLGGVTGCLGGGT